MKIRSLYDFSAEDFRTITLTADALLDQDESMYDTNWIVSADDLFGQMELPTHDYNPYQNQAA